MGRLDKTSLPPLSPISSPISSPPSTQPTTSSQPPSLKALCNLQSLESNHTPIINVQVGKMKSHCLLDSGNLFGSVCSEEFYSRLPPDQKQLLPSELHNQTVTTAKEGQKMTVLGKLKAPLRFKFQGHSDVLKTELYVLRGLRMPLNLSYKFLQMNDVSLLPARHSIDIRGHVLPLPFIGKRTDEMGSGVYLAQNTVVPANARVLAKARLSNLNVLKKANDGLVEATPRFAETTETIPWLQAVVQPSKEGTFHVGIINSLDEPVTVPQGTLYGVYTPLPTHDRSLAEMWPSEPSLIKHSELIDKKPPPTTAENLQERVELLEKGLNLHLSDAIVRPSQEYTQLLAILLKYFHVLSFDKKPGFTDLVTHEIHLKPGSRPIKDAYRPLNPPMEAALKKQLDSWKENNIIQESKSPYHFQLVPVLKHDGNIRFCIGTTL